MGYSYSNDCIVFGYTEYATYGLTSIPVYSINFSLILVHQYILCIWNKIERVWFIWKIFKQDIDKAEGIRSPIFLTHGHNIINLNNNTYG